MAVTVHVAPLRDLIDHETGSDEPSCVCGPAAMPVELCDGLVAWAYIHASLDGREHSEGD
ncbi:hypothetical protein [Streptomyces poriferorum]|uniref:Uncharacterized protein n=1 Tax=Streptomyces poriferorum TaxID=2798799 RepID=A0ABY9IY82_9ACTN|nr:MULTISPECIES: hypothetical protein [unclassified Streptomyces]MDP5310378.1 hypothetical protein [Streptomyces sp. Alt4]WLQ60468.1 hypothetical protein P8A19_35815 [Streptomyces sp. Alt2]